MSRYVVIDFETYPVDGKSYIMEVGCCEIVDSQLGASWSTLVRPVAEVSSFVLNLTGILNDELDQAPNFTDIIPELDQFIGDSMVIAHNANLDRLCYERQCEYHGLTFRSYEWVDSQDIIKLLVPTVESLRLQVLLEVYGLQQDVSHRALADAEGLGELLIYLLASHDLYLTEFDISFMKISNLSSIQYLYDWLALHVCFSESVLDQALFEDSEIKNDSVKSEVEMTNIPVHFDCDDATLQSEILQQYGRGKQLVITTDRTYTDIPYLTNYNSILLPTRIATVHCILSNPECSHLEYVDLLSIVNWIRQTKTYDISELTDQLQVRYWQMLYTIFDYQPMHYIGFLRQRILDLFVSHDCIECHYSTFYLLMNYDGIHDDLYSVVIRNFFDFDALLSKLKTVEFSSVTFKHFTKKIIFLSFCIHYLNYLGVDSLPFVKDFARLKDIYQSIEEEKRIILGQGNELINSLSINIYEHSLRQVLINELVSETFEWQTIKRAISNIVEYLDSLVHILRNILTYIHHDLDGWVHQLLDQFLELQLQCQQFLTMNSEDFMMIQSPVKNKASNCKLIIMDLFQHQFYRQLTQSSFQVSFHQFVNKQPSLIQYMALLLGNIKLNIESQSVLQLKTCRFSFYDMNSFQTNVIDHLNPGNVIFILPSMDRLRYWRNNIRKRCQSNHCNINFDDFHFQSMDTLNIELISKDSLVIFPEFFIPNVMRPLHLVRLSKYNIDEKTYLNQLFLHEFLSVNIQFMQVDIQSIIINIHPEYKALIDTTHI